MIFLVDLMMIRREEGIYGRRITMLRDRKREKG
jgi:hypothetical protein